MTNLIGWEVIDYAASIKAGSSGQQAAGATGHFGLGRSAALSGQSAAGAGGSFRPQHATPLAGIQATGAAGSFRVAVLGHLTGAQSTGHAGSFVFTPPAPRLVSITFENVGSACT